MAKVLPMVLALAVLFMGAAAVCAGGLQTYFAEVKLRDLKIGHSYSLREFRNFPLRITNTGACSARLKVEAVKPTPSEHRDGYETIPDPSWIRFEHETFTVEPNESGETDVILDIPYDPEHLGKSYQVIIFSETMGGSIGVGIRSRLLFSIDAEP